MIEFQGVYVHFGTQDVISGVNLRVAAGERIGVVGPNGAGKVRSSSSSLATSSQITGV